MDKAKEKCILCTNPPNMQMVQCDTCDQWVHFECAGVTSDIENQDFDCIECVRKKEQNNDKHEKTPATPAKPTSKAVSVASSKTNPPQLRAQKLALQRLAELRQVEAKFIQRKYEILIDAEDDDGQSEASAALSKQVRTLDWVRGSDKQVAQSGMQRAELKYPANHVHNVKATALGVQGEMQRALDATALRQHEEYLNAQMHRSTRIAISANVNVQGDKQSAPEFRNQIYQDKFNGGYQEATNKQLKCTCVNVHEQPIGDGAYAVHGMQRRHDPERPPHMLAPSYSNERNNILTASNIHARQVISNELPKFSGNPAEWPIFLSHFENSSAICGFTNAENMLRLQKALKGKALDYVSSQLMLPELVPQVISTLKMVFGRPEIILNNLLASLRESPSVNANKLDTLITFALDVKNITATMQASGLHAHINNPLLMQELVEKLPPQMRLTWAMYSRGKEQMNMLSFSDWLYNTAEAASTVVSTSIPAKAAGAVEIKKPQRLHFQGEETASTEECLVCKGKHEVRLCQTFIDADYNGKWKFINELQICRTCLKKHDLRYCPDRKECGKNNCKAKHHPLLHKPNAEPAVVASQQSKSSNVLYKIVPVTIHGKQKTINTFAFLDGGSGPTVIELNMLKQLGMTGPTSSLSLKWTDGSVRIEDDSQTVNLSVSPVDNPSKQMILHNVRTVHKLDLPVQTLNMDELKNKYKHLRGLPLKSYFNARPTMIIGLSNTRALMPLKYREGKYHDPAAAKTRLGWTVFGALNVMGQNEQHYTEATFQLHVAECDSDVSLHKLVAERMRHDDATFDQTEINTFNPEDFPRMQKNVKRENDAFVAKLLWKPGQINMPDNYKMAMQRLENFESKLMRDEELRKKVQEKIDSMESKHYIRKLTDNEVYADYERKWYLPIFVVHNPNKPAKVRIVWDAAAEYKGVSLNSCLEKGPDLLTPLIHVLFNFRVGKFALSADICEMYHRVKVDSADQHSQRFLWRNCEKNRPPDVYALTVMSFGASCSPSIAQFVKNLNAIENREINPRAAESILERHYVDDMLDSVDTVEEAIELASSVKEIHARANFDIRGWLSNSKAVLNAIGEQGVEGEFCQAANTIDQVYEAEKVLGLWWDTERDVFTFTLKFAKAGKDVLNGDRMPTKRELLRLVMSVFDPLGLINFFTIQARILLQKIWRSGIEWDEIIPEDLEAEWTRWRVALNEVSIVNVPRFYFGSSDRHHSKVELHVFTDAGENAYAAVAYARVIHNEKIQVVLIGSKAKVAPLQPVTIPRMELLAAVLGARLGNLILKAHKMLFNGIYYWTDSITVLRWLKCDPRSFKQFAMFRVGEIQQITNIGDWRFVSTKNNVADLATKWKQTPNFQASNEWFTGPAFLKKRELPISERCQTEILSEQELIEERIAVHITSPCELIDFSRFSKWERLYRCLGYVKKFIDAMLSVRRQQSRVHEGRRLRAISEVSNLTAAEIEWGQNFLYRVAQEDKFHDEVARLQQHPTCQLPTSSVLRKMSPYLDELGIVRQRSRVREGAYGGIEINDPIVLPKNHPVVRLMADYYHRRFKHINHDTVINSIFEKYRIHGLRGLMKTVRSGCMACKIALAKPKEPEMGMLPLARTSPGTRPFTYVGVDFFGPFLVTVGRRSEKRYGVVFTCLTSRAVHIEVAYSLTTSSCIHAVRNFIGRRGVPRTIFSDNGTNFRSADKTLREAQSAVEFSDLQAAFNTPDTTWEFIPPASPHMGGAWERVVRSIKAALYKIITPDTKLNDEVLHNLLIEVESIINCRPLTYLSLDTAEQEALTPNHLLLGSACGNKPPGVFSDRDQYVKQSWRYSQLLADRFWKRWVAEVLPDLTGRTKWFRRVKPIQEGDVCIIVDPNLPRHTWPKGIVSQVCPGKDGQVRSAVVRTATGEFHRPAAKIAVLDIGAPNSEEQIEGQVFPTSDQDTGGEDVTNSAPNQT